MSEAVLTPPVKPAPQWTVLALAGLLLLAGCAWLADVQDARQAGLFAIGAALGAVLYGTTFGFAGSWRRMFRTGDGSGLAAQLLMVAVATALFAPMLASGEVLDRRVFGAVAPAGLQVAVGAFLFGIGMQLGGACASGTLFTVGGGSVRMLATLAGFVAGGFAATFHMGWWAATPRPQAIALGEAWGWGLAAAAQIAVLLALAWWLAPRDRLPRLLLVGAVALAALNALTLAVAQFPWSVTWAFTLWGAKLAAALGWDPTTAPFWQGGFPARALAAPLSADVTTVMDLGIVLGALAMAARGGAWHPSLAISGRSLLAALIGGLLLGYGSRIAFGCNIGAFVSGVASTSLHGWLWIAAALPGGWVGVRLRPWFGLD